MDLLQQEWVWWLLLIGLGLLLVWFAARAYWWLLVIVPVLLGLTLLSDADPGAWIAAWAIFGAGWLIFALPVVRQSVISERVFQVMRQSLPRLSAAEKETVDAGGTGWESSLFAGRPDWRSLRRSQEIAPLKDSERAFLEGPVDAFCALIDDYRINNSDRDLPPAAWELLRRERFFGLGIPVEFGGLGLSPCAHSAVIMKIASRSVSAALTVMTPNALSLASLVLRHGTDEQRQRYLPALASGDEIPCFALTGPEAGSDATAITDHGLICRQDHDGHSDVLGIRLNFDKRYVSLGPVATLIGLAFKLYDPDGLLDANIRRGITLALVPADAPGVVQGGRHDPMKLGFPNGPLRGTDVFVPLKAIIGGVEGIGHGWSMLLACMNEGRGLSLPAVSCATAKMTTRLTGAYARIRYQFRQPIARFDGVQEALAAIAGNSFAMDATRMLILAQLESGSQPSVSAAIVKYNLTERAREVVQRAMDVHAGAGISLGPRNLIGEIQKFSQLGVTLEGANILTRSLITFGQGVIRCHPCLREEIEAASLRGRSSLTAFDKVFARHLRLMTSNVLRCVVFGLTGARVSVAPRGSRPNGRYYRQLSRLAAGFALTTDVVLFSLRGELRRRGRLAGRMADVLSQLYIGSAILRHHVLFGGRETGDRALLEWAMTDSLCRAQEALEGVCANLPRRWVGAVLRRVLFPLGRAWRPVRDDVGGELAEILTVPSTARDRLTAGIFYPPGKDEPFSRLEAALGKVSMTAALEAKLKAGSEMELLGEGRFEDRIAAAVAARLLSAAEADELQAAEAARREALRVDEFWPAGKEPEHDE